MNRRIWITIVFLVGVSSWLSGQTSFNRGERFYREGKYALALDAFDEFIRDFPDSPLIGDAQFRRGQTLFHLKRYQEAFDLFRRIERRYPSTRFYSSLSFWQGAAAYGLQDYSEAEQFFTRYIEGNPPEEGRQKALLYQALIQNETGHLTEAKEVLDTLFTPAYLASPDPESLLLYASLSLKREDTQSLLSLYKRVSPDALPEPFKSRFLLAVGESLYREKQYPEAFQVFSQVSSSLLEEKLFALQRSLEGYAALRDLEGMRTIIEEAETLSQGQMSILNRIWEQGGLLFFRLEQYSDAIRYLERLSGIEGALSPATVIVLTECYRRVGDKERALSLLSRPDVHKEDEMILLSLGELQVETGRLKEGIETLNKWIRMYPQSNFRSRGAFTLSMALDKTGNPEEALQILTLPAGEVPFKEEDLKLLRLRAALLGKTGRLQEAVSTWNTYLSYRSGDVEGRLERMRVLLALHRHAEVLKEANELLQKVKETKLSSPKKYTSYIQLLQGIAFLNEEEFSKAVAALTSAVTLRGEEEGPEEIRLISSFYLGWAYYKLGNFSQALEQYLSLLREPGLNEDLRKRSTYYGAWCAYSLGNFDLAVALLNSYPREEKTLLGQRVQFLRAKALQALGKKREALEAYRILVAENPEGPLAADALYEYGNILLEFDQAELAAEMYLILFNKYPQSPLRDIALFKRGEAFYALKKWIEAKKAFSEYRNLNPRGQYIDQTLFWEGMAAYQSGEPHTALLLWEILISQHPNSSLRPTALRRAADVLSEMGDYGTALNYLTELLHLYPGEASGVTTRIQELQLLLKGSTKREAELKVRIEAFGGKETPEGRKTMIELAKLYLYEIGGKSAEDAAGNLLQEVISREKKDSRVWAEAKYLWGDLFWKNQNFLQAARSFSEAASSPGADRDLIAKALFRAMEALLLGGEKEEARKVGEMLRNNFPQSEWARQGDALLGEAP